MLFNSYEFVFLYLPIVLLGFFRIARARTDLAALWLALASLFFYGWWNPAFVALLVASIVGNFGAGRLIARAPPRRKRHLLLAAIGADLVLLGVFKYANFFIGIANDVGASILPLDIVLPMGISFFTFTQIAFLVDVYQGVAHEFDFVRYLLFVTWFPHLIAGPVIHHKQVMPQFAEPQTYRPNLESLSVGLTLFSLGLFKKVVIADQLAPYANAVFHSAATGGHPMLLGAWIGALAYALQLYFDFSGYSDMAIGLSRMFNVRLPLNFDSPYKSANIIDFWRRWHMTLSAFLRSYLYIPLGGNRKGRVRRHLNLLATMLLGGLWHGAGWNFLFWGGLHGVYLVINHAWQSLTRSHGVRAGRLARYGAVAVTFLAVVVAWVPFRAASLPATATIWQGMAGLNGISLRLADLYPGLPLSPQHAIWWVLAGLGIVFLLPNSQQCLARYAPAFEPVAAAPAAWRWQPSRSMGVLTGLVFAVAVLLFKKNSPFLYFQF